MVKRMFLSHEPVLRDEISKSFSDKKIKYFFDGTIGAAGHALRLLEEHKEIEKYIACDVDPIAIEIARKKLGKWKEKVVFVEGNFSDIDKHLDHLDIRCINGCLFDIGVSSMQLDDEIRGFSFRKSGPLDMRMSPKISLTAEEILNTFSEKKLAEIFRLYGEEPQYKKAAKMIAIERRKKRFKTTKDLADILAKNLRRKRRIHPATLIFQALRIYINDEINVLKNGIKKAVDRLCPKAKMAVISFHSLEDREVKNLFRERKNKTLLLMTKKPVTATREEIRKNPRARSAKLRVVEKL